MKTRSINAEKNCCWYNKTAMKTSLSFFWKIMQLCWDYAKGLQKYFESDKYQPFFINKSWNLETTTVIFQLKNGK